MTRLRAQEGQASVELLGMLPWLLLAALGIWQLLLAASTATSTVAAARNGSRVEGLGGDGVRAALRSLPAMDRPGATAKADGDRVTIHVQVPIIFPGLHSSAFVLTRSAELPGG